MATKFILLFLIIFSAPLYAGRNVEVVFNHWSKKMVDYASTLRHACFLFASKDNPNTLSVTFTGYVGAAPEGNQATSTTSFTLTKSIAAGQAFHFEYSRLTSDDGYYKDLYASNPPSSFNPLLALKISVDRDDGTLIGTCQTWGAGAQTGLSMEYSTPINGGRPF